MSDRRRREHENRSQASGRAELGYETSGRGYVELTATRADSRSLASSPSLRPVEYANVCKASTARVTGSISVPVETSSRMIAAATLNAKVVVDRTTACPSGSVCSDHRAESFAPP